jgi:hypothetical protein
MKVLRVLVIVILAGCCIAADPTWNPADAVKEPRKTFAQGTSVGCVTNDIPLRERQEEYARRYNEKIYAYITQKT